MMSLLVGDLGDVQGPLDESIALATAHEDESVEARGYSLLGLLALFTDDLAASRDLFEKAEALARHAGDAWCLADALGTLASIYPLHGDVEAAEVAGREGLEMARGNLDEHGIRMSLFGLALAASRRGDAALVETRAHEGLDVSRSLGDLWFSSYFLWLLADAALALGDAEAALAHANESVELAERIGVPLLSICGLDVRARIALQQGDHEAALRDAEAAVAVAQLPGVFSSYASAAFATRGLVAARLGDSDAARELLSRAEELAAGVGDVIAEERARAALASLD
jgi:tetratricopeptide (TPR) repeat protein